MSENSLENPTCSGDEEIQKDNEKIRSLHSMAQLQVELFPMLGINFDGGDFGVKEVNFYSELVHKIIDKPENVEVRSLILTEKFHEAAVLLEAEIKRRLQDEHGRLAA
jgi:hypothetical protein